MGEDGLLGIILAGGQSSRMGQDKAQLAYRGTSLLAHMGGLLKQAGAEEIAVSGITRAAHGWRCLPDATPGQGPGVALAALIGQLGGRAALIVPVDMPLLSAATLMALIGPQSAHYNRQPLPLFIAANSSLGADQQARINRIMDVADALQARSLDQPPNTTSQFSNINTMDDYRRLVAKDHLQE